MIPPGSLTPRQVANLLHVSSNTVLAALREGRLSGLKVGHQWFIERRALTSHVVASLQQSERQRASQRDKTLSQPDDYSE